LTPENRDDNYCSNMFKITCWIIGYVCMLMGYESLVLIVKFGLNCKVLEFLVKKWVWWWELDDLMLWTHVLIHFNITLKYVNCLWSLHNNFRSMGIKIGILGGVFVWVPEREPIFWVPLYCESRLASIHAMWRDMLNNTCCSALLGPLGFFPDTP